MQWSQWPKGQTLPSIFGLPRVPFEFLLALGKETPPTPKQTNKKTAITTEIKDLIILMTGA